MAAKKKTETSKKTTTKKTTTKKTTKKSDKIKLTFRPLVGGAKAMNIILKTQKIEERDGRRMAVDAPLIEGLPEKLNIRRDEVLEVTQAQYDELMKLGLIETDEEYQERQDFVENLESQHPDKLSFNQLEGNGGFLTLRDSQHKIYMDKLIRL